MTINLSVPQTMQELRPRITVVGVGGAGGNAVNNMINSDLDGVDFLVANTDGQALARSLASRKIQLGSAITQGLGAGSKPDVGRAAAEPAERQSGDHVSVRRLTRGPIQRERRGDDERDEVSDQMVTRRGRARSGVRSGRVWSLDERVAEQHQHARGADDRGDPGVPRDGFAEERLRGETTHQRSRREDGQHRRDVRQVRRDDERHVLDGVQKRAAAQATPSEVARVARERARVLALDDHPQGRQQDRPNRAPPQNYAPGRVPSTGRLHLRQAHERGVRGENQRTRDGG